MMDRNILYSVCQALLSKYFVNKVNQNLNAFIFD